MKGERPMVPGTGRPSTMLRMVPLSMRSHGEEQQEPRHQWGFLPSFAGEGDRRNGGGGAAGGGEA